ncbi:hypothetical protein BV22DRAFT_1134436 [Leucogyrophana mollusca]|uniref:Uncharacterized protein n=1 Tax=Leucogyrophana mollusca TaxID=85980 RepID=A0ACB8AZ07_9AGAM|nr:hypothetical protein BV22DRAFT_1134436 [Leucogyrophana mollusca]
MSAARGTFNSFEKGEIYVQASLAELEKLEQMLQGAAINVQDDIEAAKRQYDQCAGFTEERTQTPPGDDHLQSGETSRGV